MPGNTEGQKKGRTRIDRSVAVMVDKAASVLANCKTRPGRPVSVTSNVLQLFSRRNFCAGWRLPPMGKTLSLKGGLFIYTLTNFESRATVDVDFLMRGLNNDLARMDAILAEILSVETGNDLWSSGLKRQNPLLCNASITASARRSPVSSKCPGALQRGYRSWMDRSGCRTKTHSNAVGGLYAAYGSYLFAGKHCGGKMTPFCSVLSLPDG